MSKGTIQTRRILYLVCWVILGLIVLFIILKLVKAV